MDGLTYHPSTPWGAMLCDMNDDTGTWRGKGALVEIECAVEASVGQQEFGLMTGGA